MHIHPGMPGGLYINKMERVMGIEPTFEAWEVPVLPLNYTRVWQQCASLQKLLSDSHLLTGFIH